MDLSARGPPGRLSPDAAPADPLSPVIGAEVVAASAVTLLATAILSGYLTDWMRSDHRAAADPGGLGRGGGRGVRMAVAPHHPGARGQAFAAFVAIVAAVLAWLLWLAGRGLLPPGTGPDLTHHLLLIGYIEQHWRLPHDPQLGAYLGEMVDYTAGSHLLAALAGAWTRTDGLHAVYPLVAFTVALKSGIVFLIARRLISGDAPSRIPFAAISVLLLLLPRALLRRIVCPELVPGAGGVGMLRGRDVVGARSSGTNGQRRCRPPSSRSSAPRRI